jgi:hypothetical protein
MSAGYRSTIQNVPARIKSLPVSDHGYPIPYFVFFVDGTPDFRVMDPDKFARCVKQNLCWICGQSLGRHKAFSAGPMIAISKMSVEPPSHRECAVFAAQVCPFMLLPKSKRRDAALPSDTAVMGGGAVVERNPGATVVWVTTGYDAVRNGNDLFFTPHEPSEILWFAEGVPASRAVAEDALNGSLEAAAMHLQGDADAKEAMILEAAKTARRYLPHD